MAGEQILDLTDCTSIRLTQLAKPPKIVHGAVTLIVALLIAGLIWSLVTEADLVVRASGRVRPRTNPDKPISGVEEESRVCAVHGGRVLEVHVQEGHEVTRGQVVLRLDTEILENEIARRQRAIEAERTELAQLEELDRLSTAEFEATKAKLEAELEQVIEQVRRDEQRRESQIELARLTLNEARVNLVSTEKLVRSDVAAAEELRDARRRAEEAEARLEVAKISVDESRVDVSRKAIVLHRQKSALEHGKLRVQIHAKRGSIEAAEFELANLHVQLKHAVLKAPTDGLVTALSVQVGDVVQAGAPVAVITEQRGFRIDLDVSSEHVGHLRVGMPARVRLDAYDYQVYGTLGGTVVYIGPDTRVTTLPNGQAVASYTVRVELENDYLENEEHHGDVKLGMTGQVEIITERESLFSLLVRGIRRSFSLG